MASRQIVIIHGWSDSSASFQNLAAMLKNRFNRDVYIIDLVDYDSMNDQITLDDLAIKMRDAWIANGLSQDPRSVDAIVHSTGGLVIRAWLTRYYQADNAPIRNLVMLAPANFGSPLAHKGSSFIGRVVKGFVPDNSDEMFQVGARILKSLELASQFSWDLAFRDLLDEKNIYYGQNKILGCACAARNAGAGYCIPSQMSLDVGGAHQVCL